MRRAWRKWAACLWALAVLSLCLSAAGAVTVISSGKGDAARLESAQSAARAQKLGSYGMTPVYARDIEDGRYAVAVQSTSPFFKIARAELTVSGDDMEAEIVIGSDSYLRVYMGDMTRAETDEAGWIEGTATENGTAFRIPVPALNAPFDCAAYSRKRQRWYDRQLLIDAAQLPDGTLAFELPDYGLLEKALLDYAAEGAGNGEDAPPPASAAPEPVAVSLPDGEYSVEVNLAGGSGRASVSSPTLLIVRDGKAWARLLWSSAYYDYMKLGDTRYDNLTVDGGNSTFEIPVTALDEAMPVVADTTAMGDPIEIDYTLTFYAESIADKGEIPQEAAKKVLAISAVIIVAGAVLDHFVKRRRR